jgi:hypothetical protein
MNWQDEPWIKLYTRDTVSWKLLPWQSKALLLLLLRKVDRAGVMDIGNHKPEHAITAITDIPLEVVEVGLKPLLDNGTFEVVGNALVCVNFVDAQSTAQSDKARQKASREKRRDVTRRHDLSQNVTDGHEMGQDRHNSSQPVTNRIEENRRDESRVEENTSPHEPTLNKEWMKVVKMYSDTMDGMPVSTHSHQDAAKELLSLAKQMDGSKYMEIIQRALKGWWADDWVQEKRLPLSNLVKNFGKYGAPPPRTKRKQWEQFDEIKNKERLQRLQKHTYPKILEAIKTAKRDGDNEQVAHHQGNLDRCLDEIEGLGGNVQEYQP